tara:strand:+ start:77 stop:475 length:399 start_codon:yes stop_codon:yes gene_type:complete
VAGAIKLDWLDRFKDAANSDEELAIVGTWFTTTFSIGFGAERVAFKVNKGRFEDIQRNPRFDVRALFGFSAPVEVWQKFFSPTPPPIFHDVFPMIMRVPEFIVEGDSLVAMQNARALHRAMTIMRETGAGNV